jgi:glutamine synthetase type III
VSSMASSDRFVAVGEEEIVYIISNIFAKPQIFYYLVSDAKILRVTLLFEGRQTFGSHSNKGDNSIKSTHLYSTMSVKIMLVRKMVLYNVSPEGLPEGYLSFRGETSRRVTLQQGL